MPATSTHFDDWLAAVERAKRNRYPSPPRPAEPIFDGRTPTAPRYSADDFREIHRYQAMHPGASFDEAATAACPHAAIRARAQRVDSKESMERVVRYAAEHGISYQEALSAAIPDRPVRYVDDAPAVCSDGIGVQHGPGLQGGVERANSAMAAQTARHMAERQRHYELRDTEPRLMRERHLTGAQARMVVDLLATGQATDENEAVQMVVGKDADVAQSAIYRGGA
jgi:hypothetical protein